jgi:hypothetical protein
LIARTILAVLVIDAALQAQPPRFRLEEATIAGVHRAIQSRQITCRGLVQAYLDRAKAYNGVSNRLVTRDGASIPQVPGTVRAGSPLMFPIETVAISTLLPNFDQYGGPPIEIRPDGTDRLRFERAAAVRHDGRRPERGSDQRARHHQPSRRAIRHLVPVFFPDVLYRLTPGGTPLFHEFAAMIKPAEFAPGKKFGSGTMAPIDYMVGLADGRIPPPKNLNIRFMQQVPDESLTFRFHFVQYATRRAADWAARGFTETLVDFPTLNARSKFWGDDQRAAFRNWEEVDNIRRPLGEPQGIDERILLRELLRRTEMKVIQENRLDLVVRLHYPLPPGKIGLAPQPGPRGDMRGEIRMGPFAGLTEVLIPAGFVRTVYDPVFALSEDKKRYVATNNNTPATLPEPGLPFSLVFRADPGREDQILRVASAYEAASKRRIPPPMFGALQTRSSR